MARTETYHLGNGISWAGFWLFLGLAFYGETTPKTDFQYCMSKQQIREDSEPFFGLPVDSVSQTLVNTAVNNCKGL